ncbi:MAG: dTDP-4-dehydrorhamnose 3,5-epimerase family protein, partial [Pelagibacteraceae bacterium]|nr:dTDP-4-dehydrorhamnose 3,5-epimerase family protein [Pelagibacteraceae bacterium]
MKILNTKFNGLKIIKGITHHDKRGYFRETFKNNLFKNKNFIFWCMSSSKKNVIRGFHLQKK